jgi:hypothetical protein
LNLFSGLIYRGFVSRATHTHGFSSQKFLLPAQAFVSCATGQFSRSDFSSSAAGFGLVFPIVAAARCCFYFPVVIFVRSQLAWIV